MKKFTASVMILLLVLMQKIDDSEGFARGGCMNLPVHRGSGGNGVGNSRPRGHSVTVEIGQQKRNGEHWKVQYNKNRDEHNINVRAGREKPNGDHWLVDYTHDMGGKN